MPVPNPTRYEAFYDVKTGMSIFYPKVGNTVTGTHQLFLLQKNILLTHLIIA